MMQTPRESLGADRLFLSVPKFKTGLGLRPIIRKIARASHMRGGLLFPPLKVIAAACKLLQEFLFHSDLPQASGCDCHTVDMTQSLNICEGKLLRRR